MTRNSAAATALYVDSIIAPLLPDMQTSQTLDDSVAHALDETLGQGALGRRLVSFRLWRRDGTILYANDPELRGKRFEPNRNLKAAWTASWWPSSTGSTTRKARRSGKAASRCWKSTTRCASPGQARWSPSLSSTRSRPT